MNRDFAAPGCGLGDRLMFCESARAATGGLSASLSAQRGPAFLVVVPRVVAVALAFGTLLPAAPASKKPVGDTAPVLMARTGGGDTWADVKELQQAAEKGNPKAQAQLGEMLLRGDGIAKNEPRAVALLERAARAGNSSAAFRIGMLLMNGESGVVADPTRALDYFRAAAAGGEKEAFFNIGAAYGSARGVKRDYSEALGWLIVARQHGADPAVESKLRAQIAQQPAWIQRGERRAKEIAAEFAGKKVTDFLPPPAALDRPPESLSLAPVGRDRTSDLAKPGVDLAPPAKAALPTLPPPAIKP